MFYLVFVVQWIFCDSCGLSIFVCMFGDQYSFIKNEVSLKFSCVRLGR